MIVVILVAQGVKSFLLDMQLFGESIVRSDIGPL